MANGHGGKRKNAGRKKGSLGERTRIAKEAIELVFDEIGGVQAMADWAKDNRGDFYKMIYPKLIPVQLNHADADGEKLGGFEVRLIGPSR